MNSHTWPSVLSRAKTPNIERFLLGRHRSADILKKSKILKMYGNSPHKRRIEARRQAWLDAKSVFFHDEFSDWSVSLWARNLTDEKVATRGFFFGNEPDLGWTAKKYVRYGAPRQVGVTVDYNF